MLCFIAGIAFVSSCTPTIKTENEVTIKPIQITLDVKLKVDRELDRTLNSDRNVKADSDSDDVRSRRRARRESIQAWKQAKLIGENNSGLLQIRTADGKIDDAVREAIEAENTDRKLIFETIAKRENIPAEAVARRMAGRMNERAASGTWIQDASGNWTVKP